MVVNFLFQKLNLFHRPTQLTFVFHHHAGQTLNVKIVMVHLHVHVYRIILEHHRHADQSVQLILSVLVIQLVLIKNVQILVLVHVAQMLCVLLLTILLCVPAIMDLLVIHSLIVNQFQVRFYHVCMEMLCTFNLSLIVIMVINL